MFLKFHLKAYFLSFPEGNLLIKHASKFCVILFNAIQRAIELRLPSISHSASGNQWFHLLQPHSVKL